MAIAINLNQILNIIGDFVEIGKKFYQPCTAAIQWLWVLSIISTHQWNVNIKWTVHSIWLLYSLLRRSRGTLHYAMICSLNYAWWPIGSVLKVAVQDALNITQPCTCHPSGSYRFLYSNTCTHIYTYNGSYSVKISIKNCFQSNSTH